MQKSILGFLGEPEYPIVFNLTWCKSNPTYEFLNEKPKNSIYITKIKWLYSKNDLHLYITDNETLKQETYKFASDYTTNSISLLKSQLQKSIRRQMIDLSVNIAYQFINLDFNEFLRRILIITLEDVMLDIYYPVISWMLIAYSKNKWKPTREMIEWLLNYVRFLCINNYKENYKHMDIYNMSIPSFKCSMYNSLIYSMEIRKSFGGMTNDIKMINWFIHIWKERFTNNNLYTLNSSKINDYIEYFEESNSKKYLLLIIPENMLNEGVDFHNYPKLLNILHSIYYDYTKEDIKRAIWECSSKTNNRKFLCGKMESVIDNKYIELWNKIKLYKIECCKKYLINNLKN